MAKKAKKEPSLYQQNKAYLEAERRKDIRMKSLRDKASCLTEQVSMGNNHLATSFDKMVSGRTAWQASGGTSSAYRNNK